MVSSVELAVLYFRTAFLAVHSTLYVFRLISSPLYLRLNIFISPLPSTVYGPKDLVIGGEIECKGRTITIVDASPDTREFQRNVLGMSVPAASLSYPEQPLSKSERARKAVAAVASKIDHSDPDKAAARRVKAAIKAKSAHFLKDSGRVLKFKGAWEDGTGTFWH